MKSEKYFADDRCLMPDDIKRMSKAELQAEIARLETEERAKNKPRSAKTLDVMRPSA